MNIIFTTLFAIPVAIVLTVWLWTISPLLFVAVLGLVFMTAWWKR